MSSFLPTSDLQSREGPKNQGSLTTMTNSNGYLYTRTGDWYFCTMFKLRNHQDRDSQKLEMKSYW